MHPSVMDWVGRQVNLYELAEKDVLEVGSRNYNGTVRHLFRGKRYLGIDMDDGPDVDLVAIASDIPFEDESFDVVVTTEMLEHDPYFWLSMKEMSRVLRKDGYMLLTTRGIGFPYHEYPGDYWRFTEDAIRHLFKYAGLLPLEIVPDPFPEHSGVFGIAVKVEDG